MTIKYKQVAIQAAKIAGEILMKNYSKTLAINFKNKTYDSSSFVTEADIVSEQAIIKILKTKFPDFGIYGEESQGSNMGADYIWYIDPLDGTGNFIRHIPLFGVSIGLVHLGQPILGILYFPALNILVSAEEGKGCFANDVLVKVSKRSLSECLYYAGGKFKNQTQLNSDIAQACGLVKIIDSSSYELAQIAMGDAEIYYLASVPHDVVAGVCIIREAGGIVTDGQGNPWQLDSKMIIASNKECHREVLGKLKGVL
ncbi:MAG TPA: inositol monophosphatase family protein [Candidatus Saccharimonadales bacterium]|nr:inositol monophosphatase family protein [Candidatus Saccharimonadales bacterium]